MVQGSKPREICFCLGHSSGCGAIVLDAQAHFTLLVHRYWVSLGEDNGIQNFRGSAAGYRREVRGVQPRGSLDAAIKELAGAEHR